ncbi:MAG: DUF6537 domain-containing protein, partial [Burkholderiaceae bacterium]
GTALDVFGYSHERKTERALIGQYKTSIDEVLRLLNGNNASVAVEIARIPELIKGYGHVKERNLAAARLKWAALQAQMRDPHASKLAA